MLETVYGPRLETVHVLELETFRVRCAAFQTGVAWVCRQAGHGFWLERRGRVVTAGARERTSGRLCDSTSWC